LRDNILYVASATEALARLNGMDPRAAYTAGLLRMLGQMVLDRACRGQVHATQRYTAGRWPSFSAWEGSLFGVNSCEVTALILDEWRFPAELGIAIRSHYLARSTDWDRPLAVLLNVANGLAHRVNRSCAGEARWWEITPEKLSATGLTEDDLENAVAATELAFDAATAALAA
jgi:HD-like signal output (HDOD) protein